MMDSHLHVGGFHGKDGSDESHNHLKRAKKKSSKSIFGEGRFPIKAPSPVQKIQSFFGSVASAVASVPLTPTSSELKHQPLPHGSLSLDEFYQEEQTPLPSKVDNHILTESQETAVFQPMTDLLTPAQKDILQEKKLPKVPKYVEKTPALQPISLPEIPQLGSIAWSPLGGSSSLADALLLSPSTGNSYFLSPEHPKSAKRESSSKDLLSRRSHISHRRSSLGSVTSIQLLEADLNYLNWLKRLSQTSGNTASDKRLSQAIRVQALSHTFDQKRRSLLFHDKRGSIASISTLGYDLMRVEEKTNEAKSNLSANFDEVISDIQDFDFAESKSTNSNLLPVSNSSSGLLLLEKPLPLPSSPSFYYSGLPEAPDKDHAGDAPQRGMSDLTYVPIQDEIRAPTKNSPRENGSLQIAGLNLSPSPRKRDSLFMENVVTRSPQLSSKKAAAILGDSCPVDLAVENAMKSLPFLLSSHLPLCYFLLHLLRDQSAEILYFILDSQEFEQTDFETSDHLYQAAQDMYAVYMATDAPLEINITYQAKRAVADGIRSRSLYCFSKATEEIMALLEDSFRFFKMSPLAREMSRQLGRHTVYHPNEDVLSVIKLIRQNLIQVAPHNDFRARQNVAAIRSRTDIFLQDYIAPFWGLSSV